MLKMEEASWVFILYKDDMQEAVLKEEGIIGVVIRLGED